MKMKLLRCMSILCTVTLLSALPYTSNLMNVQAASDLIYDDEIIWDDDPADKDTSIVSKDGCFRYCLMNRDDTAAIVGYIGEDANIKVPEKIDGKKVSRVGSNGEDNVNHLSNNEFVKQITFPEGITVYNLLAPNVEKISFYSSKEKSEKEISTDIRIRMTGHENLKEADLRQISHLGECSFPNCTNLKSIYLPSPGNDASARYYFPGCTNLTDVYYDDTESSWARIVGPDTPNNDNFSESEELIYKAKKHFKAKKDSGGWYSVWSYNDCRTEKERSNPAKKCTFIPGTPDQKTLKVPDTVVLYKGGSPVKITRVSGGNFYGGNNSITSITIGKNVTGISDYLFRNCPKLKKITIHSTKLYSHISIYDFELLRPNTVIKVPKKQLAAYKKMLKDLKVKVIA